MRVLLPSLFIIGAFITPRSFAGDDASADPQAASSSDSDACYGDPRLALKPGSQSAIEPQQAADILKEAGVTGADGLKDAALIYKWIAGSFKGTAGGGATIGKTTAQDLLKSRELTGCHDWAMMLSTLLRSTGHPARMVDTAGAQWMTLVRGSQQPHQFIGHVFVEAYLDGSWTLLDSVSPRYIKGYDHTNPFIPMDVGDQTSYCVMFKGADPAAYGIGSVEQLNANMISFAKAVDPAQLSASGEQVADLPDVGPSLPPLSDDALTGPCTLDPSHRGIIVQFQKAGLDVNAEKSDGAYLAHLYNYGRVFAEPIKTMSFATLPELRSYLFTLGSAQ